MEIMVIQEENVDIMLETEVVDLVILVGISTLKKIE